VNRGLSRLSDQEGIVAMSRGSRPNPFYIVMCDINMTTFDKGKLTVLGWGV